jgi:hypothetical protein
LALREQPPAGKPGETDSRYVELASLVPYEHMQAASDNPQFAAAMAKLEADDTNVRMPTSLSPTCRASHGTYRICAAKWC